MNKRARLVRDEAGIPYMTALRIVTGEVCPVALNADCLVLQALRMAGCSPDPKNPNKRTCECARCIPERE